MTPRHFTSEDGAIKLTRLSKKLGLLEINGETLIVRDENDLGRILGTAKSGDAALYAKLQEADVELEMRRAARGDLPIPEHAPQPIGGDFLGALVIVLAQCARRGGVIGSLKMAVRAALRGRVS